MTSRRSSGSDLREFLFGSERENLAAFKPLLREIQSGTCFYCRKGLKHEGNVDHFVPWSRYPVDLGHNFVLAHAGCNRSKRDYLAAEAHLENWVARNENNSRAMEGCFNEKGLTHHLPSSVQITRWAYEQAEKAGADLWVEGDKVRAIRPSWRTLMPDDPGAGRYWGMVADR